MNVIFVTILIATVFLYTKFKFGKTKKLQSVIGIGDLLLLLFLCLSFSTISFCIVLVGSFVFSLAIHIVINKKSNLVTVPLAAYMSLFFSMTYIAFWSGIIDSLYNI